MKPFDPAIAARRRRSQGVGIVTAIFLLVVLAGLAVAMVTLFNNQQQGILLDEQGVRAQQAARAGIEWGLFHRLRDTACQEGTTYSVALGGEVLKNFTVSVTCTRNVGPVEATPDFLARWVIGATACAPAVAGACPLNSNNPDYVRRRIEVQI